MKFKVERSKFIEGLKYVQNIVAGKGSLPVLQNVLIETAEGGVRLTTTDLDISIVSFVECEINESGSSTLPVKLLFNSVSKLSEGELTVDIDSADRGTIISGNAKYKLAGMKESDFPKLPSDEEAFIYKISQNDVRDMLRKVSYAASQDDTRRTLKGVLIRFKDSQLTMVATDGRRLAMVEKELEFPKSEERDIVLPYKAVAELLRSLSSENEIELSVQKSQIKFKIGNVVIYSKLIEDVYPDYNQVIPKSTQEHIEVDRVLLLNALERVSVMTMDEAHSTKLIFEEGKLVVTSAASDIGEAKDEVAIKFVGEPIEITFNPTYLMDCLKAVDDDEVTININNGHSPAVINTSESFLYVIMPLRIS